MKVSPICRKMRRKLRWMVGGSVVLPVLSGCDPEIQTIVLGGLNDLAVTFVDALFLSLQPEGVTPVTTMITDMVSMLG